MAKNKPGLNKNIGVWLVISDGPKKGNILLQQRAKNETSFPYLCQPTWNGKVEEGETLDQAIRREAQEELGDRFIKSFDFDLKPFDVKDFFYNGQKSVCYNFVGKISQSQLGLVKLHLLSTPHFISISKKDMPKIKALRPGIDPKKQITLFEDQHQSLEKLFSMS